MSDKRAKKTAKKAPKAVKSALIMVRVAEDLLQQIDGEIVHLTAERNGEPLNRSEAVRLLLREALARRQARAGRGAR